MKVMKKFKYFLEKSFLIICLPMLLLMAFSEYLIDKLLSYGR